MTIALFEQLVAITEQYLGPAAHRFVTRQITFHLDKAPEDLEVTDLPRLIEWTKVTLALLTEDQDVVNAYAHQVSQLVAEP